MTLAHTPAGGSETTIELPDRIRPQRIAHTQERHTIIRSADGTVRTLVRSPVYRFALRLRTTRSEYDALREWIYTTTGLGASLTLTDEEGTDTTGLVYEGGLAEADERAYEQIEFTLRLVGGAT